MPCVQFMPRHQGPSFRWVAVADEDGKCHLRMLGSQKPPSRLT
jgi:hypothetical protein